MHSTDRRSVCDHRFTTMWSFCQHVLFNWILWSTILNPMKFVSSSWSPWPPDFSCFSMERGRTYQIHNKPPRHHVIKGIQIQLASHNLGQSSIVVDIIKPRIMHSYDTRRWILFSRATFSCNGQTFPRSCEIFSIDHEAELTDFASSLGQMLCEC